jgi:serine/threonine protein kinase
MLSGFPPFYSKNKQEIYQKILYANPNYYNFHSANAIDLMSKLLCKDPHHRLGTENGAEDIKNHPFFESIDWDKMLRKEITPPYIPLLDNKTDLKHFDNEITKIPIDSPPFGNSGGN